MVNCVNVKVKMGMVHNYRMLKNITRDVGHDRTEWLEHCENLKGKLRC